MEQAMGSLLGLARANPDLPAEALAFLIRVQNAVQAASSANNLSQAVLAPNAVLANEPSHALYQGLLQAAGIPLSQLSNLPALDWVLPLLVQASSDEALAGVVRPVMERLFGPDGARPLTPQTFEALQAATSWLAAVSPDRARSLLRTLALVADLGGEPMERTMRFIANEIDLLAGQLAQKGGLPLGATEPPGVSTPMLGLQLGPITEEQFQSVLRTLFASNIQVAMAGRDTRGNAQIHIPIAPNAETIAPAPMTPTATNPSAAARGPEAPVPPAAPIAPVVGTPAAPGAQAQAPLSPPVPGAGPAVVPAAPGPTAPTANPAQAAQSPLTAPTAPLQYAFNYYLAGLFPWFDFSAPVSQAAQTAAFANQSNEIIPTMLDLVRMEPLLLGWEPGELMIPGTTIPLLIHPDAAVGWRL
jgi:hypothetical protein